FFFLKLIRELKNTLRCSWFLHSIHNSKSISNYMYYIAIMYLMVNRIKATYIALIYNIREVIIGDIAPVDGI
ncbi:hypothetical protein P154DRAFT_376908, partial [Amniculicola lignicola CBS 123094]